MNRDSSPQIFMDSVSPKRNTRVRETHAAIVAVSFVVIMILGTSQSIASINLNEVVVEPSIPVFVSVVLLVQRVTDRLALVSH